MAKISYHEFRPGRWARLVDGKIVGPATPEEVKEWQRHRADGQTIWEDVVDHVPTRPELEAEHSVELGVRTPTRRKPPEPDGIWEDVLKQASPPKPPPEQPPKVAPRVRAPRKAKPTRPEPAQQDRQTAAGGITKLEFGTAPISLPTPGGPVISKDPIKPESKPKIKKARKKPRVKSKPRRKRASSKQVAATKPKPVAKKEPHTTAVEKAPDPEPEPTPRPSPAPRRRSKKKKSQPEPRSADGQEYLWIMAEPAGDLASSVREWLSKYQERFAQPATVVLCHASDQAALEGANLPLEVRQTNGIPPQHFWIGLK